MKTKFMLTIISLICVWLLASVFLRVTSTPTIFNISPSITNSNATGYTQYFLDGIEGNKISVHKYPSKSQAASNKVIIYAHGNTGRLNFYFEELQKVGTVYSPTYPGYSESEGSPSMEGAYDAVIKTYDWVVNVEKIPEGNITIFGHSLGGSIATYLASQKPKAAKLVLVNTFSSIQSMCWRQYSILCIFAGDLLNSAQNAKKVTIPVTQFALPTDHTVPYQEGQKLFTYFPNKNTSKFITMTKETHTYLDWDMIRPEL
jgi:uncharacterized protein